jgi:hypothetical protein
MPTIKLLWGTTWRGGAWGTALGALLGALYGTLFLVALFLFAMSTQSGAPSQAEDAPRGLVAVLFLMLIGSGVGSIFGIPTGILVGFIDGLLIGILTRAFFYPLRNAQRYRRVIGIVSALFSAMGSWIGFALIMLLYAREHSLSVMTMAVVGAVPALIAGLGGVFISNRIAHWYESESKKGVIENA